MKHISNSVLGSSSPEPMQRVETLDNSPSHPSKDVPRHTDLQQDFAQLLARYKRAGYEVVEQWNQTHRVNK